MSVPFLDYLPCDLTTYSQTVLPAWHQAHQGDFKPLRELMGSAQHISYWPIFNLPKPLPDAYFAGPQDCFGDDFFNHEHGFWPQFLSSHDFPSTLQFFQRHRIPPSVREELLQEIEATDNLNFWAVCSHVLPSFFDDAASPRAQHFLLGGLLFTFCCHLPSERMMDARYTGNEDVDAWQDYISRDPYTSALWNQFGQPAPQPLADQLLAPRTYQDYLASSHMPAHYVQRRLFAAVDACSRYTIAGFLDPDETAHLLNSISPREDSELEIILHICRRESKANHQAFPPELEQQVRMLYQRLRIYRQEALWEQTPDRVGATEPGLRAICQALCAVWGEEYSPRLHHTISDSCHTIQRIETETLSRFHHAIERGWGMLKIWQA